MAVNHDVGGGHIYQSDPKYKQLLCSKILVKMLLIFWVSFRRRPLHSLRRKKKTKASEADREVPDFQVQADKL